MNTIMKAVKEKAINFVWHFTRLQNLDSILQEGLKSRQVLEGRNSPPIFNDYYRLDGHKDAICCSIGHPNYKMFYSLRMQHKDVEWIVLVLSPAILWEKDCAFCVENAASNNVTSIPIENRKGVIAFTQLFDEIDDKPPRVDLGISEHCPTNPQAEILVFDDIKPEYIIGAVFQNKRRADEYNGKYNDFEFRYHRSLFSARSDYDHW